MTSTAQNTNGNAKTSKLPIPLSNANASSVKEDIAIDQAKKPPFESRKSAEELKLRLASAVSAKIALGKDGRNSSSNTANRGIGFLLQRKEQQDNKLNTKDISFQKSPRNGSEKPVEMMAKKTNSSVRGAKGGMNKAELQKSLLSALMNSRVSSGGSLGQNKSKDTRVGSASKLNSETKTNVREFNKAPLSTPKKTNENLAKKSDNGVFPGQTNGTRTDTSRFNKSSLSTPNPKSENTRSKPPLQTSNSSGGILDRAKNIERLLGQRKLGSIVAESIIATKDVATNGKDKNSGQNKESTKNHEATNGENNRKFGANNKAIVTQKPLENVGKKLPPPVAKKPSKEDFQKSKQTSSPLGTKKKESTPLPNGNASSNGEGLRQNEPRIHTGKRSSPQIQRKAGTSVVNGLSSKNETAFREDLLEKLEADVGRCKIAAFQSMEDFSVLRMKVYRMRGELDQLKRDREKRTSLVC